MENAGNVLNDFWNAIMGLLQPVVNFCLAFLPDGDPSIFSVIDSIGQLGHGLTFNVFYFVDFASVLLCFGVLVTVILIINVVKLVFRSMSIAHMAIETIPVIE